MDSKERLKRARKRIKESGISQHRNFITATCIVCKKQNHIRTNNKALYTDEILNKWVCVLCSNKKRKEVKDEQVNI